MSYNNYCSRLCSISVYWCRWTFLYYKSYIKTMPSKEISTIQLQNETETVLLTLNLLHMQTSFVVQSLEFFFFWYSENTKFFFPSRAYMYFFWNSRDSLWNLKQEVFISLISLTLSQPDGTPALWVVCRVLFRRRVEKLLEREVPSHSDLQKSWFFQEL